MSLFGAYDGLVEVELWAERGGLASWQVYKRRFNYTYTFTGWATPAAVITAMSEVEDEQHGLELGAVDYITKPVNPAIVLARVRTHLALYDQNRELARQVRERTADLFKTRQQIIRRLGRAAEFRDNETGNHIIRMSHFCRLIGIAAGLGEKTVEILYNAYQFTAAFDKAQPTPPSAGRPARPSTSSQARRPCKAVPAKAMRISTRGSPSALQNA